MLALRSSVRYGKYFFLLWLSILGHQNIDDSCSQKWVQAPHLPTTKKKKKKICRNVFLLVSLDAFFSSNNRQAADTEPWDRVKNNQMKTSLVDRMLCKQWFQTFSVFIPSFQRMLPVKQAFFRFEQKHIINIICTRWKNHSRSTFFVTLFSYYSSGPRPILTQIPLIVHNNI